MHGVLQEEIYLYKNIILPAKYYWDTTETFNIQELKSTTLLEDPEL